MEDNKYIPEEKKEEVIEIIGDALYKEVSHSGNRQNAEIVEAAMLIMTFISITPVFATVSYQTWRVTHPQQVKEIKRRAQMHGITVTEEIIDEFLGKIAKLLGKIYPPLNPDNQSEGQLE